MPAYNVLDQLKYFYTEERKSYYFEVFFQYRSWMYSRDYTAGWLRGVYALLLLLLLLLLLFLKLKQ